MNELICILICALAAFILFCFIVILAILTTSYFNYIVIDNIDRFRSLYMLIWLYLMYYYWNVLMYYTNILLN